jgi:hypothetical protein
MLTERFNAVATEDIEQDRNVYKELRHFQLANYTLPERGHGGQTDTTRFEWRRGRRARSLRMPGGLIELTLVLASFIPGVGAWQMGVAASIRVCCCCLGSGIVVQGYDALLNFRLMAVK